MAIFVILLKHKKGIIFHIVIISVEVNTTFSTHCFHANNVHHIGPARPGTSASMSSNPVEQNGVTQGRVSWSFSRFTQTQSEVDLAHPA